MATFSGGLYYRLLRGAFRCILWPLRRDCGRAGKELYDNFSKKGTPEVWDFIFSVVGVLAGVLNVLLARLVFHFIV